MKNAIFWDVMLRGSCKKHVSEERIASILRVTKFGELRMLAVTSNRRMLLASVAGYWYNCSYLTDPCHPDDGGDIFLRNIGSSKSHMA
jgi:hypothetical protein